MRCTTIKLTMLAVLAAIEESQMRTFACVVFVLYLGLAGTANAQSGVAGTGLSRSALPHYHYRHHHHHHHHHYARSFF